MRSGHILKPVHGSDVTFVFILIGAENNDIPNSTLQARSIGTS